MRGRRRSCRKRVEGYFFQRQRIPSGILNRKSERLPNWAASCIYFDRKRAALLLDLALIIRFYLGQEQRTKWILKQARRHAR
jgi:hypothetical protein